MKLAISSVLLACLYMYVLKMTSFRGSRKRHTFRALSLGPVVLVLLWEIIF